MRFREYYYDGKSYTYYNHSWYELVFEHNYSSTSKCFSSKKDALNINENGKYSILYDLNSTKYLMKDKYRYFILDYPNLNKINSWRQRNSPTVEKEKLNVMEALGFERYVTELPMEGWGGLVLSQLNLNRSLLDGLPGISHWQYAVAMICVEGNRYVEMGYPASFNEELQIEVITDRIRLWAARGKVFPTIPHSCVINYNLFRFQTIITLFMLLPET
ncbi:hypothetical protein TVAG_421130 [Trichomonas vaginalis G3]|uniref:Uncharacterized protein n=1 Tax=Trichomonas vaginalis (strain ATCC PRA-98 / G3) TaxID=412133 RepID=A2EVT8_TRIV3|nr:hypothetical protein TVAGG3_0204270 [Trichomonas vaginalis G3]EAY03225.1 hypothetical protein TVAG_421130 [Trichomonas vaginalis G3]KAI5550823.1 hypothetical protein TVAGG3_0204270 [Trichomonas vaginalis G3]|eukprot:XP_001315448.1 hypothetical protein [Trichomonas vaginalis G3]